MGTAGCSSESYCAVLCRPWQSCWWLHLDQLLSLRWLYAGWLWPHVGPAEWCWPFLVVLDECQQNLAVKARKVAAGVWQWAVCGVGGCVDVLSRSVSLSSATCLWSCCYWSTPPCAAYTCIHASTQASPSLFVGLQFPWLKCRILCPEQGPHLAIEPWFLVGEHFFVYSFLSLKQSQHRS